ncbi:MAG: type IV pilus secretin PilQ [Gammaproteobacteria bacterium]|nr:type IV pilus secretin PilQ [Gammaproteobacteria bacterium]MBU2478594.1 type IV pilus secretin PilQ [Gammaproteobacteria bacterium]
MFLVIQAADAANTLESVDVGSLPGNKVQVILKMSEPAEHPLSFTIDNPARIALDLPDTRNGLGKAAKPIGVGLAKSLTAVEAQGRTRVVLNLVEMAPYETRVEGNMIVVTLQDNAGAAAATAAAPAAAAATNTATAASSTPAAGGNGIQNVDFRRGDKGEGRIIITLPNSNTPIDMRQEAGQVVLELYNTSLPENLERRLDVADFATPVQTIDTFTKGKNVRMVIAPSGEYDHVAYQTDNLYTVEIKPTTKEQQEVRRREQLGYTGERLSLNFQDIEVRSVLQLIADFTGTNIVVSDTVTGNLTLRLQNVPWDQALDIVLKTKGLAMRKNNDVILVAPSEEIAAREKLELESQKQIEELAPLYSEYMQVNYAKAEDISTLLKGEEGTSMLSERGTVSIDERTNTLLIRDTAEKLADVRKLVAILDIPVRQVLIESRIVIASDDFARDIGVRLGGNKVDSSNTTNTGIGGGLPGDVSWSSFNQFIINPGDSDPPVDALLTDLRVTDPMGAVNFVIGRVGKDLLRLELSAMQAEGKGEVISSPRVITANQKEAVIRDGVEIPYLEASSSGATSVSFKEAVLQLRVTPQITPDDRVIMDLKVNQDTVGDIFSGVPSIDTRAVETQVLVDNGETAVLGGIYIQENRKEVDKIPFLGDLPGIGFAFRTTRDLNNKSELLIFVTPKILKDNLAAN